MKKILVILLSLLTLSACGFATPRSTSSGYSTTPTYSYTTPAATPAAKTTLPLGSYGPGTYVVGADIQPGTYATSGPDGSGLWPMCYYARLKNLDGDLSAIIANGNFKGRMTLNVKPTDVAVEFDQDCIWTKK